MQNPQFLSDLINQAIKVHEDEIVKLNTQDQIYDKSVKADGSVITPHDKPYTIYSFPYEKKKKKAGLYRGKVDLNYTGQYLDSFDLTYLFQAFKIEPNSQNADLGGYLKNLYGDNIEGFTAENLSKIGNIIRPTLLKLFRNALQL